MCGEPPAGDRDRGRSGIAEARLIQRQTGIRIEEGDEQLQLDGAPGSGTDPVLAPLAMRAVGGGLFVIEQKEAIDRAAIGQQHLSRTGGSQGPTAMRQARPHRRVEIDRQRTVRDTHPGGRGCPCPASDRRRGDHRAARHHGSQHRAASDGWHLDISPRAFNVAFADGRSRKSLHEPAMQRKPKRNKNDRFVSVCSDVEFRMRIWSAMLFGASTLVAGATAPESGYGEADFARVAKFDAHVHANVNDPRFLELARRDGFQLLAINVDYPDFPPVPQQAAIARAMRAADPKRLHFATTFSMEGFGTPGWTERTIRADR
jgi:hypothetical protein